MDVIPLPAIEAFSTSKGVFDNGSIPFLETMPSRCFLPDPGNGPEDFMSHDDRKRSGRSASLSFINPHVRTANSDHLNSEHAFLRTFRGGGEFF